MPGGWTGRLRVSLPSAALRLGALGWALPGARHLSFYEAGAASERDRPRVRRHGRGARAHDQHGRGRPGAAALRGLLL